MCDAGFAVQWVDEAAQAIAALERMPSVVLVDLAAERGIADALEIRNRYLATPIVLVADPSRPALSDQARRAGFERVMEPPLAAEALLPVLLAFWPAVAVPGPKPHARPNGGIVACSAAMKEVAEHLKQAGTRAGGVLVCGEPGTGRRYVARALHAMHCPPESHLVEVDCAPAAGLELEAMLFGTVTDGAAATERVARGSLLFQAFGGTLLLLNVADMAARVQRRLVRVLRDGEATVAGAGKVQGSIRAVACVDPAFDVAVEEGRVRPDLFKRLAVTRIDVPPLRSRREDIPDLVARFVQDDCVQAQIPAKTISQSALTLLTSLPYRNNARELRLLVATLVEQTPGPVIMLEDVLRHLRLDAAPSGAGRHAGTLRDARAHFEQQYIGEVLDRYHGRIADAARALGIQRTNLYRKMRTLGVSRRPGS